MFRHTLKQAALIPRLKRQVCLYLKEIVLFKLDTIFLRLYLLISMHNLMKSSISQSQFNLPRHPHKYTALHVTRMEANVRGCITLSFHCFPNIYIEFNIKGHENIYNITAVTTTTTSNRRYCAVANISSHTTKYHMLQ